LEDLVNRGLVALKKYIKRPEWVAALVHENIFRKILASFAEGLKRKALSIEHGKSSSSSSSTNDGNSTNSPGKGMEIAGSTPSMRNRNRKKSTAAAPGGGRASFHQNTLILQSLEEEFRVMDFGWERNDFSDLRNKPSAWIDFLRGCVRFRCYSGVLILKQVTKVFPLEQSNTLYGGNFLPNMIGTSTGSVVAINTNSNNNSNTTSATTGGGGASFLNRLFASDPTPDPMAPSAEPRRAGSITTTTMTTSGKQDDEDDMMMMSKNSNKKPDGSLAATSSGEKSIYDGILSGFKENPKIYNDLSTTAGSFVFQNLKEVVSLELESMKKLIAYRIYSLKTILLSAYAFIVHMELQQQQQQQQQSVNDSKMMETMNNPNFPSHLSKIILALSEEKKCLAAYFHQISLEYGGNKYDYYLSSIQHHNNHHHGHGHHGHHHDHHGLQPSPPQTQPSSSKKSGSSHTTTHKSHAGASTPGKTNTSSYNGDSGVTPFYWESDESDGMGADGASDREGGGAGGGRRSKGYSSSFGTESELLFHISASPGRPAVGRKPSFLSSKPGQLQGGGGQSSSTGRSYATYLFEELCKGTLECYEEILKKLMTGQLFDVNPMKLSTTTTTTTTGAAPGKVPFRALRQCYEEMEFFKVSLFCILILLLKVLSSDCVSFSFIFFFLEFIPSHSLQYSGLAEE
jgi:hypothetical protein